MSFLTNYLGIDIRLDKRTALYGGSFNHDLTVYEVDKVHKLVDYINGYIEPVLLDVGASTGSYSLLPLVVEGLKVHSFEPSKAFEVLTNNIELNNLNDSVVLNNVAVSNEVGKGMFYEVVSKDDSCLALSMLGGRPADHKRTKEYKVQVTTIDEYCKNIQVDAIKIDVEGNELNVLKGAIETIKRDRPVIMFEYSQENANQYGYNPNECIDLLDDIGYFNEIIDNDVISTPLI